MIVSITPREVALLRRHEAEIRSAMLKFKVALEAIKAAHYAEIPEGATFEGIADEGLQFMEQDESNS